MSARDGTLERIRAAAMRIANSHGLELFDVQFRRETVGWVLRVIVDRLVPARADEGVGPDGAPMEALVSIDDCRQVSHDLGTLLDVEDDLGEALGRAYTLEVSSPGLDRPLRGEADYRRFAGRLAKIVTHAPVGTQTSFAGRLAGVEDGAVVLNEGRRTHRVPLAAIKRARLEVEF
jgi:ribosome maturation factor RimP